MTMFNKTRAAAGAAFLAGTVALATPATAFATVAYDPAPQTSTLKPAGLLGDFISGVSGLAGKILGFGLLDDKTAEEKDEALNDIFGTVAEGIQFKDGQVSSVDPDVVESIDPTAMDNLLQYAEAMLAQGIFDGQSEDQINSTLSDIYGTEFDAVELHNDTVDPSTPSEEIPAPEPEPSPEPESNTSGAGDSVVEETPDVVEDTTVEVTEDTSNVSDEPAVEVQQYTGTEAMNNATPQLANTGASIGLLSMMGAGLAGAGAMLLRRKDA